jgi:hypothetical protein
MSMMFEIIATLKKVMAMRFKTKNVPLPITTAIKILKESCALVYLMMPAKVLICKKTAQFTTPNINRFLASSGILTDVRSKLCFKV